MARARPRCCACSRAKPRRPKGLSREVVDKISAAARRTLEDAVVRKRIEDTGSLIVANTPEQFAAQIRAEFEVYRQVVEKQKLTLD